MNIKGFKLLRKDIDFINKVIAEYDELNDDCMIAYLEKYPKERKYVLEKIKSKEMFTDIVYKDIRKRIEEKWLKN